MNKILALIVVVVCLSVPLSAFAQKVGGGELVFKPKNASPVIFSHEKHVIGKGLKCTGCHYQIFQMSQGSYKMDMNKITKGDFCGKCHNGQKGGFDAKDPKNCVRCHRG